MSARRLVKQIVADNSGSKFFSNTKATIAEFPKAFCYRHSVTTQLFSESNADRTRPGGVTAIAIVCFALAAYLPLNGILIVAGVVSLASGAYVLGEYSMMGPVLFLAVAVVLAVLGWGLLRGWNWTRRLAVVAAALLLATAVMPVSAAVIYFHPVAIAIHGAKIIASIVAIRFLLLSEVVDYFRRS
ncbi:MAG TPA: hypothetical protein VFP40_18090 [Terriglobales bacterium]|nr:hypothetical protein [Terriglobales bacterium]